MGKSYQNPLYWLNALSRPDGWDPFERTPYGGFASKAPDGEYLLTCNVRGEWTDNCVRSHEFFDAHLRFMQTGWLPIHTLCLFEGGRFELYHQGQVSIHEKSLRAGPGLGFLQNDFPSGATHWRELPGPEVYRYGQ